MNTEELLQALLHEGWSLRIDGINMMGEIEVVAVNFDKGRAIPMHSRSFGEAVVDIAHRVLR